MDLNVLTAPEQGPSPEEPRVPQPDRERLEVFDSASAPADPRLLRKLEDGVSDLELAAAPVVLPDFHHKEKSEMPSSIAVATRDCLRPALTDAALNCGMAFAVIDTELPPLRAVADFYRNLRERYPHPPTWKRELTSAEVLLAAVEGADFAAERFGLGDEEMDRVEERGRLEVDSYGGAAAAKKELPWLAVQMGRLRFGSIGPSTHFVELQQVEEVLDEAAAAELGLAVGQITVQYHNGGGVLTSQIGALYGRRKSASRLLRAEMSVQRPLAHLATARSGAELRRRLEAYFRQGAPSIPLDGDEGRKVLLANRLSMNYGFAYRMATFSALRDSSRRAFGAGCRLIVDSPHNSMYEEQVAGGPAFVHRHNACRAFPASRMAGHPAFSRTGQPVLLPGTNRTSSYLCVPDEGAERSLYTACHGTGSIISAFARSGRSGADPQGHLTWKFGYGDAAPVAVGHLDDLGVNEALGILTHHRLVRPVLRMRPLAVLT